MKKQITVVCALIATSALAMTACSSSSNSGDSNAELAKDGSYSMALSSDPGTLSPLMTASSTARSVINYLYDRMVFIDPSSGEVKPWLAESWTESPSQVSYKLKTGITCSDGSALTPQTVADNFNFVADKANKSPLRGAFVPGDLVATADGSTVLLKMSKPSPFLLANTAALNIVCQSGIKNPDSLATASVGTGLFKLNQAVPNDHYSLDRRDGYSWGPDNQTTSDTLGVPKTVNFKIVSNSSTAANLVLSGELNAANVTGADEDRLGSLQSISTNRPVGEMFFNQAEGKPTADAAVREALTSSIDLNSLAKIITAEKGGISKQLSGIAPLGCQMETTSALPSFDADGAAKKLTAAGWALGSDGKLTKNGQPLTLNFIYENSQDTSNAAAEYAQQQWAKVGVTVTLKGGDENFMVDQLLSGKKRWLGHLLGDHQRQCA
ncbi:ABC transporter substrate-binding protein [Renibacterium salmoninarum]|nr:ABC transporter substrate-binding protein [Renibacterium salmoninarum]